MRRKEFLENVAVPLLGIAVVMFIVYLFCVENGVCDYRKLWIVSGMDILLGLIIGKFNPGIIYRCFEKSV